MHDAAVESLAHTIAMHLSQWERAHVELAIYGSDDATAIARAINEFCREQLGSGVAHALFHQSSIGAVSAVELRDGRRVVIKAHQPEWSESRLAEIVRLERQLASRGLWAPAVLLGPVPLGQGFAVVEEHVDRGARADPHDPTIRRALAASLHEVIEALASFVGASSLPSHLLSALPAGALWPVPHSQLFDFERTREGADDIDALAGEARACMAPAGRVVLGHGDWRVEHVRFESAKPVVAFDWDSLCREAEPALVGFTAHAFCADWTREHHPQAPTFDEARAFVAEYEAARGKTFDIEERRLCGAAFTYSMAYTARCRHALGNDERATPGTFQQLVATLGRRMLQL
jgi:hypothetical protein